MDSISDTNSKAQLAATSDGSARRILLTGSTGYVGGRLAPLLLKRGHQVVCLVREPRKLQDRDWSTHPNVEIVQGDVGDRAAVSNALGGCDTAYYLVHAMESGTDDFVERDRHLAESFRDAAQESSLDQIIYLGGLGEIGAGLSEHLASRREVEGVLRESGVPTTVFRAAMILGSGSASFETLRYLVERLPVMVTPRWVRTRCQPVSIVDVLEYLLEILVHPELRGEALEIGGPTVLTYRDLMQTMAEELKLPRRVIVPLPVLTPTLSSLWIGLVTPVSPAIARPLAEGLRNEVVVHDERASALLTRPAIAPREAIHRALTKIRDRQVVTRWSAAGPLPGDPDWAGGKVFVDKRSTSIRASADSVFAAICGIGGGHGWYAADFLWRLRGFLDQLVGGPGLRRGRRDPETVEFGEALDFWRVTDVARPERLVLRAEMKLPGVAELSFDIEPRDDGVHELFMTARFRPKGLLGLAYWYTVLPLHHVVFSGMLRGIKRAAESNGKQVESDVSRAPSV